MTKLGVTAKDTITGFEGVVLGRCVYITGCNQVLIQPEIDSEGKFVESRWFDEDRVQVSNENPITLKIADPGPDKPAPRI
jgi:hypothetical protein